MPPLRLRLVLLCLGLSLGPILVLAPGLALAAPGPRCAPAAPWPDDPAGALAALHLAEARALRGRMEAVAPVIRLGALTEALPFGALDAPLCALAAERATHPLVAATATWLRHEHALQHLDLETARRTAAELGLLTAFVIKPGPAPHPTAPIDPAEGWRPLPPHAGGGMLWLEALLRPARDATVTLASRVHSPRGGPAVLRLGYDDTARAWLNGDPIYTAPQAHRAALDQAAVPVVLRRGDNRLVIEVTQETGAWRLLARFTDARGAALPDVVAHADAQGPPPDPADGEAPARFDHLYTALRAAAEPEDRAPEAGDAADDAPTPGSAPAPPSAAAPSAEALRTYADYARHAHLPEPDLTHPRVLAEAAFELDPSPASLTTWLALLPDDERAATRSAHTAHRPVTYRDHLLDLWLRLDDARRHYYARRHPDTRAALQALLAEAPGFGPARALWVQFLQDLGLSNRAVAELAPATPPQPEPVAVTRARVMALRSAGRPLEAMAALHAQHAAGQAGTDERYHLAGLHAARGETDAALALLDAVHAARPELQSFALEAAEVLAGAGRGPEAIARLEAVRATLPTDGYIAERVARLYAAAGLRAEAAERLAVAVAARPDEPELVAWLERLRAPESPVAPSIPADPTGPGTPPISPTAPTGETGEAAAALAVLGPPVEALAAEDHAALAAGAPALVLYHHARAEVGADGRAVRRLRRVVRILNDEGARRFGEWELSYVPSTQRLAVHRARLLRPGAPTASPRRSDRDLSEPDYRLYYDLRAEVLTFDRPRPGDVIEVAWSITDTDADPSFPDYFGEVAWLQEQTPRAHTVVEVAGPGAARVQATVVGHGVPVARDGLRFEAHGVPGGVVEPGMPGPSSLRAYVHLSTLSGWAEADARYRKLVGDRFEPTERLRALAREWVGAGPDGAPVTDPEAVVRALYTQVAHRTRYVGLEFGVRSFQPATPAQTLSRGFGDCKDKATLLIALARSLGVEAHIVLVRTRGAGAIDPGVASFAVFDHAMVYVPALDRFVDPTVDRNDPFTLPPSDQGALAFVVGHDATPRITPSMPATANTSAWDLALALGLDGQATGRLTWTSAGHPATVVRRALEAEGARREYVEQALGARFPGAAVSDLTVTGLDPAHDPVVVAADVRLPSPPRDAAGHLRWPLGGAPWRLEATYAQAGARQNPLELEVLSLRGLRVRLALPPGASVRAPAPAAPLQSPFGQLEVAARTVPGAVGVAVGLSLTAGQVAPADYPAFRAWLAAADRALGGTLEIDLPASAPEAQRAQPGRRPESAERRPESPARPAEVQP